MRNGRQIKRHRKGKKMSEVFYLRDAFSQNAGQMYSAEVYASLEDVQHYCKQLNEFYRIFVARESEIMQDVLPPAMLYLDRFSIGSFNLIPKAN